MVIKIEITQFNNRVGLLDYLFFFDTGMEDHLHDCLVKELHLT